MYLTIHMAFFALTSTNITSSTPALFAWQVLLTEVEMTIMLRRWCFDGTPKRKKKTPVARPFVKLLEKEEIFAEGTGVNDS